MNRIGIEIGGTKLQIVAGTPEGRILDRVRLNVNPNDGGEGIRAAIQAAIPRLIQKWDAASIGVGFGGPVDHLTGRTCCSHQVRGWHDFPLGDWIRNLTGLKVRVENDANTAALGEALCGAGRDLRSVVWINMGSGVGGGWVLEGRIHHGRIPGELELGHLRIDRQGTTLEKRCSGWAVDARIRNTIPHRPESILSRLCVGMNSGEARHLRAALAADDLLAQEILGEIASDLAHGLGHVVHILNPDLIVMGGGLSLVGEPLRSAVATALEQEVMEALRPAPKVSLAGLGEDSVPVGALLLDGPSA